MSLEKFLDSKRREYLLNEKLQEWSKGSKILDEHGFPLVTFHGTFSSHIEEIKISVSHHKWFAGSGFYTSNSIDDINLHYVKNDLNNDFSAKEDYLIERLYEKESIIFYNNLFNINLNDYLLYSDESIGNSSLTYESANYLLNHLGIKKLYFIEEKDDIITFEDFLQENSSSILKQNDGCIYPVFIKMERPLYLTKDDNATMLTLLNTDQLTFLESNQSEPERFLLFVDDLYDLLKDSGCPLIKDRIESFYREFDVFINPSTCSEEFFIELNDYLTNEYDFEDEELDELLTNVKELMQEYGYYNLEEEMFEEMIYFSIDFNNESTQNYKNFIDMLPRNIDYKTYIYELNKMSQEYYEENDTYLISFYDFHNLLKNNEELIGTEFSTDYQNTLHNLYDGVVLSVDSLIEDGIWKFNTPLDTYHYIVFDPSNVKSALGNTGDYSLENLKICAKMHNNQINETKEKNIESVKKYINKFQQEYTMINFSYEYIDKDVDALYDREQKNVVFNSKHIHNLKQLKEAFIHEVFGHFALDFVLGKDKNEFLEYLNKKIKDSDLLITELKYPHLSMSKPKERLLLVEEKIAEYAESKFKNNSFLNRMVSYIEFRFKKFKQKFGLSTFKDDVFVFLHSAKNIIEDGVKNNNNQYKNNYLKKML